MSEQQIIEAKLKQIERLVGEVKRLVEADPRASEAPLALGQESLSTVPDWP